MQVKTNDMAKGAWILICWQRPMPLSSKKKRFIYWRRHEEVYTSQDTPFWKLIRSVITSVLCFAVQILVSPNTSFKTPQSIKQQTLDCTSTIFDLMFQQIFLCQCSWNRKKETSIAKPHPPISAVKSQVEMLPPPPPQRMCLPPLSPLPPTDVSDLSTPRSMDDHPPPPGRQCAGTAAAK